MIDSHAHIYSDKFKPDVHQMIARAREHANVGKILMPNIDLDSIDGMLQLEKDYPGFCLPMMGLHPCHVGENYREDLEKIEAWFDAHAFVAVGEMGLDYYWDTSKTAEQKDAFRIQAGLAKSLDLPLVVHSRDAMADTIALIAEAQDGRLKGVLHCFTGTLNEAKQLLDLGFYLGIGGVATFKNGGLDQVIPTIGIDKLLLETDSPYLAPKPYRGKRNEPAYLREVCERVAELNGLSYHEVETITDRNTCELFSL